MRNTERRNNMSAYTYKTENSENQLYIHSYFHNKYSQTFEFGIEDDDVYNNYENNRLFDILKYHPENRGLINQSIFDSYYLCNTLLFMAYYILHEEIEDLLEVLSINELEDDFVSLIKIKKNEKEN